MTVSPTIAVTETACASAESSCFKGVSALQGFPSQGELVTYLPEVGRSLRGWLWVCRDTLTGVGGHLRVDAVLFDPHSQGQSYTVIKQIAASQVTPVPGAEVGLRGAPLHFGVLGDLAEQNVNQQHKHAAWVESIVSEAQEWADQHNMCEAFEEFMHDHELAGRERELTFEVRVEMTVSIPITSCHSERDAREEIDNEMVMEAIRLELSSSSWEVDED